MLYLRTGANGSCKTLFTLKDVRELQLKELRPVAWNGRFKLKPEIEAEFGWKRIEFKDWQAEPDGTIFLMDECHNDLPRRPNGSAVPEYVSKLAEHRARGFDFFLLTQHPMNIDTFVVKLVGAPGWHQHLKRAFGASNVTSVLQWSAVNTQCEKDGAGKSAQVTMRSQPKDVYGWYDSAELHTGKRKIPRQFWMVVAGVPLAIALLVFAGKLVWSRTADKAGPAAASAPAGAPGQAADQPRRDRPKTTAEYIADYRPRLAGLMHTAPVYDELTKPSRVPVAAACVMSAAKGCKCFTQDATPYPIDQAMCRALVEHGTFYAFAPETVKSAQLERPAKAPETAQARSEPILIGEALPSARPAAPAPAPEAPQPQRIASVKR